MEKFVIAYDVGTTGVKTCLFSIDKTINLLEAESMGYHLYTLENGGAEQDTEEWWDAMCATTKKIMSRASVKPEQISGLSFCSQMQCCIMVDKEGNALRPSMNYLDHRAEAEMEELVSYGLKVANANIFKLLPSLYYTGVVSSSPGDPVWKYKWVEKHEPDIFAKTYKWLDAKEYLICRCTGEFIATEDTAFSTMLYDIRKGHEGWCDWVCKHIYEVNTDHLPKIIKSTDQAGVLRKKQAEELGLVEGIPVFGGGGDASLIGVGSGSVKLGDTYIYSGTSGWVSTLVDKQFVDAFTYVAGIVGAQPGLYNYFAQLETSGKCLEWCKDHIAADEVGIYLEKHDVTEDAEQYERRYTSLYEYMTEVINQVPAGANGVIFAPWLHGTRCPVDAPEAGGMFFNLSIDNGKSDMFRAVIEGISFHDRWMLEASEKKAKASETIRFVGGGALSDVSCQIMADVLNHTIETVASPQNVGAVGAAAVMAVGLGLIDDLSEVCNLIPATKTFVPNPDHREIYDRNYEVFKRLYGDTKKEMKLLNSIA